MALGNALLQAITGSMYKPEENPFGIAGQAIAQGAPYLSNPYGSAGKNALYTVGAGLLAGLLGGVARNQTESDNLALMKDWSTAVQDPTAREAISAKNSRLASAINALQLEEQQREAEAAQKLAEQMQAAKIDIWKRGELIPMERQAKIEELQATIPIEARAEAAKAQAKIQAENTAWNEVNAAIRDATGAATSKAGQTFHPDSPQGKAEKERFTRAQSFADDFRNEKTVQHFELVRRGLPAMYEAFKDKTGVSDVELTRRGIQTIEPGLAVRGDDERAILESPNLPAQWKHAMIRTLQNGTKLPDDVREGLLLIGARSYKHNRNAVQELVKGYTTKGARYGVDPVDFNPYGEAPPVESIWPDYEAARQRAEGRGASTTPQPLSFEQFQAMKKQQRQNGLF